MLQKNLIGTIVPHSLTTFKGLTDKERLTLIHLLILKDVYRSETFFHSNSQFIDELGFTEMTVIKVLRSLQEKGFIQTNKSGRRKATEYTINISKIAELPKYSPAKKEKQEKVVPLQPDNQQVKEKLIVEEKPIKVKENYIKVEEPKTEPVSIPKSLVVEQDKIVEKPLCSVVKDSIDPTFMEGAEVIRNEELKGAERAKYQFNRIIERMKPYVQKQNVTQETHLTKELYAEMAKTFIKDNRFIDLSINGGAVENYIIKHPSRANLLYKSFKISLPKENLKNFAR